MKIQVGEDFAAMFAVASKVAPARSPQSILRNVRVEASGQEITIEATDMERSIKVTAKGEVLEPGVVLLPADRVQQILQAAESETVKITASGNEVVLASLTAQFKLPTENPDEFPRAQFAAASVPVELDSADLQSMIRRTFYATDTDSSRYSLGGVLFEVDAGRIQAIGTDGRRLSMSSVDCGEYSGAMTRSGFTVIPKGFLMAVMGIHMEEKVKLYGEDNYAYIESGPIKMSSRLIEGRFPAWKNVIPNTEGWNVLCANSEQFEKLVKQAQITQDGETRGVFLTFSSGYIRASSNAQDVGSSNIEMPCEYEGEEVSLKLDSKFLLDFLKPIEPESMIEIRFTSGSMPVLLNPVLEAGDIYRHVLMPMSKE